MHNIGLISYFWKMENQNIPEQLPPLTQVEEIFCLEYMVDMNQTKAYMRAFEMDNYSSASSLSYRLFRKVQIVARIKELMEERAQRMEINQDWVILSLKQIRERCLVAEPVLEWNHETKQMEPTGEYKFDSNGANRATELIGKHMGMFTTKLDIAAKVDPVEITVKGQKFAD